MNQAIASDRQSISKKHSKKPPVSYVYIENQIKKKIYGILSTVSPSGRPQAAGVAYGVMIKPEKLTFYVMTGRDTVKVRNIQSNPNVVFTIPYPHYYLRMAPSFSIQASGTAQILDISDEKGEKSFQTTRLRRSMLNYVKKALPEESSVFIKVTPGKEVLWFGIWGHLLHMMRHREDGFYRMPFPG